MARLPALIDAIAQYDGRGRPTLEHMARLIREANYIQTTKRGRGAAEMTEADAVALLIGVNANEDPGKAADAVRVYSSLRRDDPLISREQKSFHPLLREVVVEPTLSTALAALLRAVPAIRELAQASKAHFQTMPKKRKEEFLNSALLGGDGFSLEVAFNQPIPFATIAIWWLEGPQPSVAESIILAYHPDDPSLRKRSDILARADRRIRITVGLRTLSSIHNVLWPSDLDRV